MKHVFWLIEGKLAGRSGPDRTKWDLRALREGGFGAILTVNDGLLVHPKEVRANGLAYACVPLSDNAPAQPGDAELCLRQLPIAGAFVDEQLAAGRATLVHCSSGKDRTGLFLAYHLVTRVRLTPEAAFHEVRRVRPIAFTAPAWDEHALDVLQRVG